MDLPRNYSKEMFETDLKEGKSFTFKAKAWVQFIFIIGYLAMFVIGAFLIVFLMPVSLSIALIFGAVFFVGGFIGILVWLFAVTKKIKLTPEGISWKTGAGSKNLRYVDFDEIEFFMSPFIFNLETAKMTDTKFKTHKMRISLMTAPKKWYSEEMIRSIIDRYWRKANPKAKYSKKTVVSTTSGSSEKAGTVSLLKPKAMQQETPQGYKCPNCLVIHKKKQKFCPKCGAQMS